MPWTCRLNPAGVPVKAAQGSPVSNATLPETGSSDGGPSDI